MMTCRHQFIARLFRTFKVIMYTYLLLATQCFILVCHATFYIFILSFQFHENYISHIYVFIFIFLGQKICLFLNGSLSWWRIVDHSPRQRYANKEYIFYDYILVSRKMIFFFPGHFDDLTTRFYVACVVSALGNNNIDKISNLVPI